MNNKDLTRTVLKNTSWNFASMFIGRVGALAFTILIARFMMPGIFGVYSLAMSIALLFLTFADLGINQAMIRYVSSEIEKNKKKALAYFKYIFKLKILVTLIASLLLLIVSYPLSFFIFKKPALFLPLVVLSAYIFIFSFIGFFEAVFYLKKQVKYVSIKEIVFQTARILIALFVFSVLLSAYYVLGVIAGLVIASLITLLFIIFCLKKIMPFIFEKTTEKIDKMRVLKFLGFLIVGNLSTSFFAYVDIIMIGIFLPVEYAGYYKAVFALVFGIAGLFALTNVLLPFFTQLKSKKLEEFFNKVMKYSLILVIPISFGIFSLSNYIIFFVYGAEYLPSSLIMNFASFVFIPAFVIGLCLALFSAREKPANFAKLTLSVAFLNILLNFVFILSLMKVSKIWATTGAAIATLVSSLIYMFGAMMLSKRILKIKISPKHFIKPIVSSLLMILLIYYLKNLISDINLLNGGLLVIFGAISYFVILFVIKGISLREIKSLKQTLYSIKENKKESKHTRPISNVTKEDVFL